MARVFEFLEKIVELNFEDNNRPRNSTRIIKMAAIKIYKIIKSTFICNCYLKSVFV